MIYTIFTHTVNSYMFHGNTILEDYKNIILKTKQIQAASLAMNSCLKWLML